MLILLKLLNLFDGRSFMYLTSSVTCLNQNRVGPNLETWAAVNQIQVVSYLITQWIHLLRADLSPYSNQLILHPEPKWIGRKYTGL